MMILQLYLYSRRNCFNKYTWGVGLSFSVFSFVTYLYSVASCSGRVFIKVHTVRKLFKELMEMEKQQIFNHI